MRAPSWIVGGLLFLAVVILTHWFTIGRFAYEPSPPGQYPLGRWRPQWPATESVGLYRPDRDQGNDSLSKTWFRDAKMSCGSDRVHKICTLPTVPLVTPYRPTHLEETTV